MSNDCWLLAVLIVNCVAAAIAVIDGDSSGIEPMVPMAVLVVVAKVYGSGNNGIFSTTSHNNGCHPCPHPLCPCPCPPPSLDKGWTAGWSVRHDASHLRLINLKGKEFVFGGSNMSNWTDRIAEKVFLRKLDFYIFVSHSLPARLA